jgi:NAD(P)-dependent dehydrogenase (short-subunit alcohol dehydrogenase family)
MIDIRPVPFSGPAVVGKDGCSGVHRAWDNIRVNTIHPGGVVTPIWKTMDFWPELVRQPGGEAGAWKALGATAGENPLKRFATAKEIAQGILYLASDESSFMTGTELVIDGGYTA